MTVKKSISTILNGPVKFREELKSFGDTYFNITIHDFKHLTRKYLKLIRKEFFSKNFTVNFHFLSRFEKKDVLKLKSRIHQLHPLFKDKKIAVRLHARRRDLYKIIDIFSFLTIYSLSIYESHLTEKYTKLKPVITIVKVDLKGGNSREVMFPKNIRFI